MADNKEEKKDALEIFNIIEPYANEQFSKLQGIDLQYLILLINEYTLKYRKIVGLPDDVTFGVEIEFENANEKNIKKELERNKLDTWGRYHGDGSLHRGAEISSPIMIDKKEEWQDLYNILSILQEHSTIGVNAGAHVHVGADILGPDKQIWENFIKTWIAYENIIFRFSYGEFLKPRPDIGEYAKSLAKKIYSDMNTIFNEKTSLNRMLNLVNFGKYYAINFGLVSSYTINEVNNTIEFRCANGTLNPVIWQNLVNLYTKLLLSCKSSSFNLDIVEKRIKKIPEFIGEDSYNLIYLEEALEFCDLVFTNNKDKVYFLHQYLKHLLEARESENYLTSRRRVIGKN